MANLSLFLIYLINFMNYKNDLLEESLGFLKFPFNTKIKSFSRDKLNFTYNETNFIDDFFNNPIFINISIGTPQQNIKVMLDQNDDSFSFLRNKKIIEYNSEHINNINYTQVTPYNKNFSFTSKNIKNIDYNYESEFNNLYELEDVFYLYKYSEIKNESIKNTTTFLNFLYGNNKGDKEEVFGKIGLDMNNYKDILYPRFFNSLKNQNIIKKYLYYFDFYSNFHGYLIVGSEPHLVDVKNTVYKEYQYLKINTVLSKEGYVNWSLLFNKIIIKNKTNDYTFNLKENMAQIDFNFGLIIGTSEYQKFIEKNFFNLLINNKICNKTLVDNNNEKIIKKYYIYKCNESLVYGENFDRMKYRPYINYFEVFPDFQLFHVNLEHYLYISNFDLFRLIHGNYYFQVIFDAEKENKIWKFGQIFLRSYILVFDYDSKIIGYYDRRIQPPANNSNEKNSDDKKEKDNNYKKKFNNIII